MAHLLEVCPSPYQPQLVNIKHELTAVLLFSQMEMVLKIAEKKNMLILTSAQLYI